MGKKGSWLSAIKKAFTHSSKEKLDNEYEKRAATRDKKKKGLGKEGNSFIPLFREPSSIEKILGEAEREHHNIVFRPPSPLQQTKAPPVLPPHAASPRIASPRAALPRPESPKPAAPRAESPKATSTRAESPKAASIRATSSHVSSSKFTSAGEVSQHKEIRRRPEPTLRHRHASATKIQATYRGYVARRSFRALKGLVRLQGVIRGQNVKRQTANAMKHMQMLVRVQTQIQSRRIQMLETQALQRQMQYRNDKEVGSTLGKWSTASAAGFYEDWDDSVLTKEEIETRMNRKVDAMVKRERAMAYAYSHQLWKGTPKEAPVALMDPRSGGFPWWWNWLERQLPSSDFPSNQPTKTVQLTPTRSVLGQKLSPAPQRTYKEHNFEFDAIMGALTPNSTTPSAMLRGKQTPTPTRVVPQIQTPSRGLQVKTPNRNSSGNSSTTHPTKYSRPRTSGNVSPFNVSIKDDDSLTSCPPFSVPNYMVPTASAAAKARATSNPKERFQTTPTKARASSNPKERFQTTPTNESKRRISFPLSQGIGAFKWNRGSFFSNKDTNSQKVLAEDLNQSIGDLSVDSTASLPLGVRRKSFNRFV